MVRNYRRIEGDHKHKGRIDQGKLERCIELIEEGWTAPSIEKETGVSIATIGRVRRNLRRYGNARAPRLKKLGRPPKNKTTAGTGEFILEGVTDTELAGAAPPPPEVPIAQMSANTFENVPPPPPIPIADFSSHVDLSSLFMRKTPSKDRALVILNQPIASRSVLSRLWSSSGFRLCCDGGANQLYELLESNVEDRPKFVSFDPHLLPYQTSHCPRLLYPPPPGAQDTGQYELTWRAQLPNAVHGDLDSIHPHVSAFYSSHGVAVTQDPDQYSSDFGKAIKYIVSRPEPTRDIVILGSIAGRMDQGIGLLSEMAREQERNPLLRIWLVSEENLTLILDIPRDESGLPIPGRARHLLTGLRRNGVFTPNCGILPVYGPATISTRGLEWDVEQWHTEMGAQVSTSNHVTKEEIMIETDARVLFTIQRNMDLPRTGGP